MSICNLERTKMARYDNSWFLSIRFALLCLLIVTQAINGVTSKRSTDDLTACQHLRRAESRRSKALSSSGSNVRIPRCTKLGEFEKIQCLDPMQGLDCWCVDEYGIEVPGTRNSTRSQIKCVEPEHCSETSCRMFCPSGFARDTRSGCSICRCRDPCDGIECPNGQSCQQQEVKCKTEPCPPIPTCKKARSFSNYCPAGLPLAIEDSVRPFLCGIDPGKPQCPPLYQCMVESGNDYGVCCPNSLKFQKPGVCPNPEESLYTQSTGYMCGTPCSHDLECRHMEKCCYTKGCQLSCQQPFNITTCHQAKAMSEILAVSEREGRGYVPDCNGPGGMFAPKQCSRNGLVCWCVDPRTGHKIKETMGSANSVDCDGWENMIARSLGRSFSSIDQCDTNICAAVCEYGFKNDHNGCPTCECSEPCDGYKCPMGSHCEIASDPLCSSGSVLCASWPVCKPDLVYSNPCDIGTPLADNITGEVMYCFEEEERQSRSFQPKSFFDEEPKEGRALTNRITCPANYKCMKLHREQEKVCCPLPEETVQVEVVQEERQQTMCEYLRDFPERMEGTEEGMQLAIPSPKCSADGSYEGRQCTIKSIKVTRAEQRKILEENTVRRMRMLLQQRIKRDTESLKLYRVDDKELHNVRVAAPIMGRNAKVIDGGASKHQGLGEIFEFDIKKVAAAIKRPLDDNELVEMDVEECWCVDGFGTEIPRTRGFNVTDEECKTTRDSIDCLDLTCRMGCEYGFNLDSDSRCPVCSCRDPCEGVVCGEGKECRTVDVSCEDEYCPPVPACLPRKPGQCPFLVPPGANSLESNTCDYECRTDSHCDGTKRCCSNGCGTQCVDPQMKTACQHLQAIQRHQASEIGIPAKQTYIAQCDESGKWNMVQCGPDNICWCVDDNGEEISGTRIRGKSPVCKINSAFNCPMRKCVPCENGYKVDSNGCQICQCRDLCDEISCLGDEECKLINVECVDSPCPKMPICIPRRESLCPEGNPLKQGDSEVGCGPHNEKEACPTTHTCQLNPVTNRGVCCTKTRDVCFESMNNSCLAKSETQNNATRWRFNPKANKCVSISVTIDEGNCQSKNLFHSELACNSVCPVLTQCERLKLKNSLAAQRSGSSSVWFQPRCDPFTGHWSPIQCLGKQPSFPNNKIEGISRAFSSSNSELIDEAKSPYGVCWCADKKGAPLKGTLTRDFEPICNHRQARRRMQVESVESDPLLEDLIRQMTFMIDLQENSLDETDAEVSITEASITRTNEMITEKALELANSIIDSKSLVKSTTELVKTTTRCKALATSASFPVACNAKGAFLPTQCNGNQCWCVDDAGNQLPSTGTFHSGSRTCTHTPIGSVAIELHLENQSGKTVKNLYDILKMELFHLVGDSLENLRVQEDMEGGDAIVRFELHDDSKIDTAFAIEETIRQNNLILGNGQYRPDITTSHFIHRSQQLPIAQAAISPESTIQMVVFILATSSAFLVSIFVVFIMLKRGKKKVINNENYLDNKVLGSGDKYVDFSSPIFVLSANEHAESIKQKSDNE